MNHFHLQFSYNYPERLGTVEDVLNAWWTEKNIHVSGNTQSIAEPHSEILFNVKQDIRRD
jgi:hypothetical protein